MFHKSKKRIIFVIVLILCLMSIVGGAIYYKSKSETKNYSNKKDNSIPPEKPPVERQKWERIKIKKSSLPGRFIVKCEWENGKCGGNGEYDNPKEGVSEIFQDWSIKSVWVNWEQELKDDAWLVKECQEYDGKKEYFHWYENDQGKKIEEYGSRKYW